MLGKLFGDPADGGLVERPGEVEAPHFGPDMRAETLNRRHAVLLSADNSRRDPRRDGPAYE
jgi:hypothetical protein